MVGTGAVVATVTAPADPRELRRLARRGSRSLVSSGIGVVANFALTVVVARVASPEAGGLFFAATSVHAISVGLCRLGGGTGLTFFVGRAVSLGQYDRVAPTIRIARVPVLVVGTVVALIALVGAPTLAPLLLGADSSQAVAALRVTGLVVGLAAMGELATNTAAAIGTVRPLVLLEQLARPVVQLVSVGLALQVFGDDLVAMVSAYVVPTGALAAIALVWAARIRRDRVDVRDTETGVDRAAAADPAVTYRRFWAFTAPRAVQAVVQVAIQRLDIILVSSMLGPEEAVVYAAATRFLVVGLVSAHAIAVVVQPRISALLARDQRDEVRDLYQVSTSWLVLLTWPAYLLLGSHGPTLLRVFGDEFTEASSVLTVLALAMMFSMACGTVEVVLAMSGQTLWTLASSVLALVVNVAVDVVLIPRWGIDGAAAGWAAAVVVNNGVSLWRLHRFEQVHPFGRSTLLAVVLAAVVVGVPAVAVREHAVIAVVLVSAASGLAYAAAVWLLRKPLHLDAFRGAATAAG